ncbi:MAG: class I SAM-dependent DNA methyltransferase [Muribaculaceae bacterium]|nr:class I SAM-dependent DNA methyltransferase [Muribaculaceae bacterium]
MNKSEKQIAQAAERFAQRWAGKGYEKGESQLFWTELLTEVFGIKEPSTVISFEDQVQLDHTSFIDGYIDRTHTMIEQKSLNKDLRAPIKQSDGTLLTPFQQAQRYSAALPYSKRPRWIVTCNFSTFLVYDMENPTGEPFEIRLADLGKEHYRLRFLVETSVQHLEREMQVSMQAGTIVGKLYDALLNEYKDPTNPESLRSLNVLCVRLVFCLYAEDAGIFGPHDMFHDYLVRYDTMDMRNALVRLFKTLDTPLEERDPYLQDDLAAFPYANGGLFSGDIEIPRMNEEIRELLLQHASLDFDWSEISPTIFGAVFESTLNPETRRSGGMHYTSIENIHKVIDPLFLDDLRSELDSILKEKVLGKRRRLLLDYQERLASLTFFDPACGSGNFLTETYLSLRRLENKLIRTLYEGQSMFIGGEFHNPVRVSIHQFYGIEINDFAKTVATTALWISEAQMLAAIENIKSA